MTNYSVLMSLYKSESKEYFVSAVSSMLNQKPVTNDFVIVCDGPLTEELDAAISEYEKNPIFHILRIAENKGLGNALKEGVIACKNEFIFRMDSDDISLPHRVELELKLLEEGYDIVGGYISEFVDDDPTKIVGIRKPPLIQDEIVKFSKKRCPFNHPSVAYRKSIILKAGNYRDYRKSQDWDLWYRCLMNDAKVINIPEVLVNMRSGNQMMVRRGGKVYVDSHIQIFKNMRKDKYISFALYLRLCLYYRIYSIVPIGMKKKLTKKYLRETVN